MKCQKVLRTMKKGGQLDKKLRRKFIQNISKLLPNLDPMISGTKCETNLIVSAEREGQWDQYNKDPMVWGNKGLSMQKFSNKPKYDSAPPPQQ